MKLQLPWKKEENRSADVLEVLLESTLKPIAPNSEFINDLRYRLLGQTEEKKVLGMPENTFHLVLLVVGMLASGAVLILTGIRAIIAILGSLGLLQQYRKTLKDKPVAGAKLAS
ncbi:MAG: hypothetical protein JXB38_04840 [Anaerolineales bacterium]|nr:hypothetical protein [Anaerolineales bacterium]